MKSFPTDEETLSTVLHCMQGSYRVDEDGTHHWEGSSFPLYWLLQVYSNYNPELTVEIPETDGRVIEYFGGPVYTEHDVIESLIHELRLTRALVSEGAS